jgi:uncharacterized membrane protein
MEWLTRHRAREYFRGSAWIVPTAAIPLALLVAPAIRHLDDSTRWQGLNFSTEGAKALLGSLPAATLTFLILVLSMLLLSVQLASSQLSPRLIGRLLARRAVKLSLSVFVFSYVYCTAALGRIDDRAPQLPIVVAVGLTLLSIAAGLFLVDYMAKELRPVRMLAATANVGRAVIENVYPNFATPTASVSALNRSTLPEPHDVIVRSGRSGVLIAVHLEGLAALSNESGGAVEVIPQVGDFVARGDPVLRLHPGSTAIKVTRLQAALAFGDERTPEQDPTFVFRILVDVACKALSSAINDPTTAVLAIDQIHHLLRQVGLRRLGSGEVRDADGQLRVLYRTPDWDDFVQLAVTEIRQYGADSIQVTRRLQAMLDNLRAVVPPQRRPVLQQQLRLLHSGVERNFDDLEDRKQAEVGDLQGVGGSQDGK